MPVMLFGRRDPWWDVEGRAARRERRRQRLVSMAAFVASLTAVSGAVFAWALSLGFGRAIGLP